MASLLKFCLIEFKMLPSQFMHLDEKEKALIIALICKHSDDLENIKRGVK